MSEQTISSNAVVIERTFEAPIDLVWQLWTDPEHFKNWYGPQGFSIIVSEMDVRVGGKRLICMVSPDGNMKMWFAGEYITVEVTEHLVYTDNMADEHGNLMNGDHAVMSEVSVHLESVAGGTKMVMTHAGLPSGDDAAQGAQAGWGQAFDKLADYLPTLEA